MRIGQNKKTYIDLGYSRFLSKQLTPSNQDIDWRNIPVGALSILSISGILNASTDIEFTATDADTVSWSTGTIYYANGGQSDTIAASNTGNMTGDTFIYFDRTRPAALQVTTDASLATGTDRFPVVRIPDGNTTKMVILV